MLKNSNIYSYLCANVIILNVIKNEYFFSTNNNIAIVYAVQNEYKSAIKIFKQNLLLHKQNDNKNGIALSNMNLGFLFYSKKKYDKALKYTIKAQTILKEIGETLKADRLNLNLLNIYIDSGDYSSSWEKAAPVFQKSISNEKWVHSLSETRMPLGEAMSRSVQAASGHNSLPCAPDGEYIVVSLATSFEHKKSALETVTLTKTSDTWSVAGYFIK